MRVRDGQGTMPLWAGLLRAGGCAADVYRKMRQTSGPRPCRGSQTSPHGGRGYSLSQTAPWSLSLKIKISLSSNPSTSCSARSPRCRTPREADSFGPRSGTIAQLVVPTSASDAPDRSTTIEGTSAQHVVPTPASDAPDRGTAIEGPSRGSTVLQGSRHGGTAGQGPRQDDAESFRTEPPHASRRSSHEAGRPSPSAARPPPRSGPEHLQPRPQRVRRSILLVRAVALLGAALSRARLRLSGRPHAASNHEYEPLGRQRVPPSALVQPRLPLTQ